MQDYVNYMIGLGADKIPHRDDNLLSHSIRVSGLLYSFGRPMDEVKQDYFIQYMAQSFRCIRSMCPERRCKM